MEIHDGFPRYVDFEPKVPVFCVTPERRGCIHRFFDTSPISPSGRYLALFQMPFEDHQPGPGDVGHIVVIDLESGTDAVVAETRGWEPQMGANLNWGGSDHELFFNDVDADTWQAFAWKLDPSTGDKQRMGGSVYHVSPDGKWLVSANMATMRKTQPGYGVAVPPDTVGRNIGAVENDGFWLTDTHSGQSRLILSLADAFARAEPPIRLDNPDNYELYGFHSKFNPQSDRLMLSIRGYPVTDEPLWDAFSRGHDDVRFAWVTMTLDGSELHCAVGPEEWVKGGHHATWFPDGQRISMNLNIDRDGLRFVRVNSDGSGLCKMLENTPGSGHPTVHPGNSHLLTDTYTWEKTSFGDGTIPLRWIDLKSGREDVLLRINTQQPCRDAVLRVDPHPAWDRTWRYVTFNAFIDGTRRVYVADMKDIV